MSNDPWLTVEEIAEELRVTVESVRRWLRGGELRGVFISRRAGYRIRRSELNRFLAARMSGPEAEGKAAA